MQFSDYFNILDYELQQQKEYADAGSADKFRNLPTTQAKRVVNESIKELVLMCPERFEQEHTYTFLADSNTYTVEDSIARILARYNETTLEWNIIGDQSSRADKIYTTAYNTIYNDDGWKTDDTLKLKVIKYPDDIENDTDIVDFPVGYIRLLTLHIKRKVFGRKNKAMSSFEYSEYMGMLKNWKNDTGKVRQKITISYKGFGFGRR